MTSPAPDRPPGTWTCPAWWILACALLAACAGSPVANDADGYGPQPRLPAPHASRLPHVDIAPARGWQEGQAPVAAPGTVVNAFASGLDHPRWLYVLPNGDVLVAETNAPDRPLRKQLLGLRGWVMRKVMQRAGAGVPSADRITLLRDADGDGRAETRTVFIDGLVSPFGMALVDHELYIADTDALLELAYAPGDLQASGEATRLAALPAGPLNHHWTKNLIASADGSTLYVAVGSNSNAAEHGIGYEEGRAAIWAFDRASGQGRPFATGLRNPVGMAWHGDTLWAVVNERDELGPELVPDYLTSVREGGFYGWPYSYYGHPDPRLAPDAARVAAALTPDYALGAHTASLGLAASAGSRLASPFDGDGMFVAQHGSWNRTPLSGYRVIFVPFRDGRPSGPPRELLSGFVDEHGDARGRPVGVAVDARGGLLVADDVGNVVWRVSAAPSARNGP